MGRVAALEGLAGGLLAVVADVTGPAVLLDEAGDLGAGEARHLLQVPLDLGLVRSPEAVVLEADQRAPHEGVGGSAVSELEVRGLVAVEKGAELVEGGTCQRFLDTRRMGLGKCFLRGGFTARTRIHYGNR